MADREVEQQREAWRKQKQLARKRRSEFILALHPKELDWLMRQATLQGVRPGLIVRTLLSRAGMPFYSYCGRTRRWIRRREE